MASQSNPAIKQLLAGLAIGNLRQASGMRHMELADKAGINRSRYSQIENGRVVPSDDELKRIHKALEEHNSELEHCVKILVAGKANLDASQLRRLGEVVRTERRK